MMARSDKKSRLLKHLSAAIVLSALAFPAAAAEPETLPPERTTQQLIAAGEKLARQKCASCHSIARNGESPNKAAPPFRTFASKWPLEDLEESLAEGIVTGHEEMPEVVFTPLEIDAFLEFLRSISEK